MVIIVKRQSQWKHNLAFYIKMTSDNLYITSVTKRTISSCQMITLFRENGVLQPNQSVNFE